MPSSVHAAVSDRSRTSPRALRKVLVTGASGFVGSHVVEQLGRSGGWHVIAADTAHGARSERFRDLAGVEVTDLDVRDRDAVHRVLAGVDSVVHLAALRPRSASSRPREAFDLNVAATYDIIDAAAANAVRRIVFGSSHSVYGAFGQPRSYRIRETDEAPREGLGFYGASKIAVEAYLAAFANQGGPEYLSLRLGTIYGPGVNRDNSLGGMMLDAIAAVRRGERPEFTWSEDSLHDLVYVADAAAAISRALETDVSGLAVNVVGDPIPSPLLFGTLVELAGGRVEDILWNPVQTRYQQVNNERMNEVLGPVLSTSLRTGLERFLRWADSDSPS